MSSTTLELPNLPEPLSRPEELANSITHALGLALSIVGTVILVDRALRYGDTLQVIGVSIYGATLVALYAASTLSHTFEKPRLRHFFRTVDQVCIFLLIAGTFTPISLTYLREGWWWALFGAMWFFALAGIFCKLFYTRLHNVTLGAYVLLGWLPITAIKPILETVPATALWWMLAGGIFYTVGTIFLMRDNRVPFFHATWHLFVIGGSICHYYAVMSTMPIAS
jgi:hemolysin III